MHLTELLNFRTSELPDFSYFDTSPSNKNVSVILCVDNYRSSGKLITW